MHQCLHFAHSLDGVVQIEEHGIKVFLNSLILTQLKLPEGLRKMSQAKGLTTHCSWSTGEKKKTKQLIPPNTQIQ